MALNPWKYYEMIQHNQVLEQKVKQIVGEESFEELGKYLFEFACEEAKFLDVKRENFESDLEYGVAFNRICRFRREAYMHEILAELNELTAVLGILKTKNEPIEITFDYSAIPEEVRKIYRGG